jgi:hypothetical protein
MKDLSVGGRGGEGEGEERTDNIYNMENIVTNWRVGRVGVG